MEFETVTVRNFMVFGDKPQTVNLAGQGLVLVAGDNQDSEALSGNGAGKSSAVEAIFYALYGQLSSGVQGDDVINNKVGKNMEVVLKVKLRPTMELEIQRYRKHNKYNNKTRIFINGEERTQKSVKATNQYIQTLFGMSKETFLNSILFGLGNKVRFTEATDTEKKQLLEDIANISIYKQAQLVAKDHVQSLNQQIQDLATAHTVLETKMETQKEIAANNQQHYDQQIQEIEQDKEKVKSAEQTLKGYPLIELEEVQKLQATYSKLQEGGQTPVPQDPNLVQYQQALMKFNSEYQLANQAAETQKQQVITFHNQLQQLQQGTVTTCFYCGQELDKDHKAQEISRLTQEMQKSAVAYQNNQQATVLYKKNMDMVKEKAKALEDQRQQQEDARAQVLAKAREVYTQYMALQSKYNSYQTVKTRVDTLKSAIKDVKDIPLPDLKKKEIVQLHKDLRTNEGQSANLQVTLKQWQDVVEIYSNQGVISHVLDFVMPFINEQTNKYLNILSGGTITVTLDTQTTNKSGTIADKLDVKINNLAGGTEYDLNSRGEKKRIDLAISLALQDYVMSNSRMSTNFVGYDEVFDGLDSIGITRVMDLLANRVKEIPSIFVVSHDDKLKELFENTLLATKKNGVSTLSGAPVVGEQMVK